MSLKRYSVLTMGAYLIALVANILIFALMPAGRTSLVLVTLISIACLLLALWTTRKLAFANAIESAGKRPIPSQVFWGLMGIPLILLAMLAGNALEMLLFGHAGMAGVMNRQLSAMATAPWYFLSVAFAMPILEELTFRKVIFGQLAQKTGIFGAAMISSLLFAVTQGISGWLTVTLVGLVLAYLYQHTGALATALIARLGTIWAILFFYLTHPL